MTNKCKWRIHGTFGDFETYFTSCREELSTRRKEETYKFCPHCGKPIEEIKYE